MKVYGIFAGGGVKAAALAGCLASAKDQGVEFAGYGGTSAGAIVAALGAAGYEGREIHELLATDLSPIQLLDDDGTRLREAMASVGRAEKLAASRKWTFLKLPEAVSIYGELERWAQAKGLYPGERFRKTLLKLLNAKLGLPDNREDVTFEDFMARGRPPLKITASDITGRRVATFSAQDAKYGNSVIDAVRASAGYPFLFQPVAMHDGSLLSDGGLSSNLPTYLFASEHASTQYPILAFNLEANLEGRSATVLQFAGDLLETALEASDKILLGLGAGVVLISIPVPSTVTTLKFDLEPRETDELFLGGLAAANEFLGKWPMMNLARGAGESIRLQLQTIHGDPKLFEQPLFGLARTLETVSAAKDLRAHIMLSTGRESNSRIVTYNYGFRDTDGDYDLELAEFGGCSGRAIENKSLFCSDLQEERLSYAAYWRMTREQQAKIPADRKSMLSMPIFAFAGEVNLKPEVLPVIGALSVDSSTALEETGWLGKGIPGRQIPFNEDVVTAMRWASRAMSKLLR